MDSEIPGVQNYNGGIIFVSYLISVIGAMTALELLQRRTHIRGEYNWFLLASSAVSMGGIGIWSMHFIGNNSLTITYDNGSQHQLSYGPGFTFFSLIVAILVMFLAFAFVGITEEARIGRIIPSGILAGLGIVSMHYLGQVSVDYFRMKNQISYSIAASVIAISAVTAALFIFFKLREQWANQWYKRLGCAMLMAVAACGMHYTALVGTLYYPGNPNSGPPTPLLGTAALIGIISGIVVVACIVLFLIGAKAQMDNPSMLFQSKKTHRRLILDTIFFDTCGRILVKVDGIVPMKEILNEIPEDETHGPFTTSNPLFTRLFETTIQWAKPRSSNDEEEIAYDSDTNVFETSSFISMVDDAFLTAASDLVAELRFTKLSDLGYLFDSILSTDTISKKSIFSHESKSEPSIRRSNSTASWLLSSSRFTNKESLTTTIEEPVLPKPNQKKNKIKQKASLLNRTTPMASQPEDATVIDIFNNPTHTISSNSSNVTIRGLDSEDRHIFLVKKIESNRDLVNLLSIGYRFAEPVFISKTMGEKLQVLSEYMLNYFNDMLQMTETASTMYKPIKPPTYSFFTTPAQQRQLKKDEDIRGGVFVGLFTLIEDQEDGDIPYIIIQKQKRYAFPMVQLTFDGDTEAERKPTELTRQQKNTVLSLSGQSLSKIATLEADTLRHEQHRSSSFAPEERFSPSQSVGSSKTLIDVQTASFSTPTNDEFDPDQLYQHYQLSPETTLIPHKDMETKRFTRALESAAKSLISASSYGKPLASSAKLYSDIIDVPAFSLRSGPCQLILFRAHITTPGTRFAINQTLSESIKCVPYPLYRSYAYYITDRAVDKYRVEQNKQEAPSNYVTQQRLYQSTSARKNNLGYEDENNAASEDNNNLDLREDGSTALTPYKSAAPKGKASTSVTSQQALSSLSPPPRAKRSKFTIPTGIASLDINHINKDFFPNMLKGAAEPVSPNPSTSVEMPVILNLLPASGRFWWLNNVYEETHNV